MTKQIIWVFRELFFVQFDTKIGSKKQRLAKIFTILWLLMSIRISQIGLTTYKIRGKSQYYQAHIPRSWPVSIIARFATKDGLIQIKGVLHPWPVFGLFMHFSQKV